MLGTSSVVNEGLTEKLSLPLLEKIKEVQLHRADHGQLSTRRSIPRPSLGVDRLNQVVMLDKILEGRFEDLVELLASEFGLGSVSLQ